ncbi:MAG: GIY-YIG nuclease family protein [Candidatus Nanoarchaeia archaeon]|nr:GIY-YIG nuclease family protein [Candidatus Nanoarchaeia archaeon]
MSEQVLLLPYFYKGVIYQIINIQNRKSYIGYTSNKNPEKYIKKHFRNALNNIDKNTRDFYLAIREFGIQNFKWRILGEIYENNKEKLFESLNAAEISCIYHFRTFGADGIHKDEIYGYNMTPGGEGNFNWTRKNKNKKYEEIYGERKAFEIKQKLRSIAIEKNCGLWMLGRKLTEDHKNNISIGINNALQDEEKYLKISHKGSKKEPFSEQHRKNLSKASKGKSKSKKHRENLSKVNTGKKQSKETIEKRMQKIRGRKQCKICNKLVYNLEEHIIKCLKLKKE